MEQGAHLPKRQPRKKLNMPLFGNMGSSSPESNDGDLNIRKWIPLVIVGTLLVYGIQWLIERNGNPDAVDGKTEVLKSTWNGKVYKKYADVIDKDDIRYYLEIKNNKGEIAKIDLKGEKTNFWDKVAPRYTLNKSAEKLEVLTKRVGKSDTTFVLKFD